MCLRFRWALHNLVAHPLMVFLPTRWGDWLHDTTVPDEGRGSDADARRSTEGNQ